MRSVRALTVGLLAAVAGCYDFDADLQTCRREGRACAPPTDAGSAGSGGAGGTGGAAGGGGTAGTSGAGGGGGAGGMGGSAGGGGSGGTPATLIGLPSMSFDAGLVARNDLVVFPVLQLGHNAPSPRSLSGGFDPAGTDGGFSATFQGCGALPPLRTDCQVTVRFDGSGAARVVVATLTVDGGPDVLGAQTAFARVVERFTVTPEQSGDPQDFGTAALGTAGATRAFLVTHRSTSTSTSLQFDAGPEFAVSSACATLSPDAGPCRFTVTFRPAGLFDRSATLWVADPTTAYAETFPLRGVGAQAAALRFFDGGNALDFGLVDAGTRLTRPFELFNTGFTPTLVGLSVTGNAAFTLDAGTCTQQLAPSGSCTGTVSFAPPDAGVLSAQLLAQPDGGGLQALNLSGTGWTRRTVTTTAPVGVVATFSPSGADCTFPVDGGCLRTYPVAATAPVIEVTLKDVTGLMDFEACGSPGCTQNGSICSCSLDQNLVLATRFVTVRHPFILRQRTRDGGVFPGTGLSLSPLGVPCGPACLAYDAGAAVRVDRLPDKNLRVVSWGNVPGCGTSGCGLNVPAGGLDASVTLERFNLAFVSSVRVRSTALADGGGDALCLGLARDAGLPGQFQAVLGTQAALLAKFDSSRGWARVDGEPFIDRFVDAQNQAAPVVYYPLLLDERATPVDLNGRGYEVWTGTDYGPNPLAEDCANWRESSSSGAIVSYGYLTSGSRRWLHATFDQSCDALRRVYCLSAGEVAEVRPPAPPITAHRLFVSDNMVAVPLSEDTVCGMSALGARAVLGRLGQSPWAKAGVSSSTKPLYRPDGVFVASSTAGLSQLPLPVNVTASGGHVDVNEVWLGSADLTSAPTAVTDYCNEWQPSGTSGVTFEEDLVNQPLPGSPRRDPCTRTHRLLCITP